MASFKVSDEGMCWIKQALAPGTLSSASKMASARETGLLAEREDLAGIIKSGPVLGGRRSRRRRSFGVGLIGILEGHLMRPLP